ncbi:hypothetical protein [Fructobacillus cardui]|uniref:hypothetical protein n=1 Tax=Fructobacillus cardui TaxID=2893170 RepID=UPI002D9887A5|nr:unnamed protein product [Fructobacillus cardui]
MKTIEITNIEKTIMNQFIKKYPFTLTLREYFFGIKGYSLNTIFKSKIYKHQEIHNHQMLNTVKNFIGKIPLRSLVGFFYLIFIPEIISAFFLSQKTQEAIIKSHILDIANGIAVGGYLIQFILSIIYYEKNNNQHLLKRRITFCSRYNMEEKKDYENTINSLSIYQNYLQENNNLFSQTFKESWKEILSIIIALQYANDIKQIINSFFKWAIKYPNFSIILIIIGTTFTLYFFSKRKDRINKISQINSDLLAISESLTDSPNNN